MSALKDVSYKGKLLFYLIAYDSLHIAANSFVLGPWRGRTHFRFFEGEGGDLKH